MFKNVESLQNIQTKQKLMEQLEILGERLQKYKIDPQTGIIIANPDHISINSMLLYDDLEGHIKFVQPDFNRENYKHSIISKAV